MRHAVVPRLALVLTTVLGVGMSMTSPAQAMPPSRETFHDEGSFEIDCGTFSLTETFTNDLVFTTFFDNQGNPVRL